MLYQNVLTEEMISDISKKKKKKQNQNKLKIIKENNRVDKQTNKIDERDLLC